MDQKEVMSTKIKRQCEFIWTVESWQNVLKLINTRCVASGPFQINDGSPSWTLYLYPNGINDEDKGFVSIIVRCNHQSFVEANFELSLIDHFNNRKLLLKKFLNVIMGNLDEVLYSKFIDKNTVDQDIKNLLKEDKMNILCRISLFEISNVVQKPQINPTKLDYLKLTVKEDKFEKLLEDKKFSDVVFKVGEKEIHLHKIILINKSPVFEAMFEYNMQENEKNIVKVVDIDHDVFKEMIRFIYTGKVNEIDNIADELIVAADKYCIQDLKMKCEKVLSNNITLDNIVACLDLASMCNTSFFKEKVFEFILSNKKQVVSKPEFKTVTGRDPCLMFQICQALANGKIPVPITPSTGFMEYTDTDHSDESVDEWE